MQIIYGLVSTLIDTSMMMYMLILIMKIPYKKSILKLIIMWVLQSVSIVISSLLIPNNLLRIPLLVLLCSGLTMLFIPHHFRVVLTVQVQFFLAVLIGEIFTTNLLGIILNIPVESVVNSLFGWIVVIRVIVFLYIAIIANHLKVIDLDTPSQYWYCLSGISILLVVAGCCCGMINQFTSVNSYSFFLSILGILLALNILTLYFFKTICTISKNEQELHAIEVNYQAYDNIVKYIEKSTRQLNTLKHDIKNFQATMISLIKNQKYEDLLEYLENCTEELQYISPAQDKLSGNTMIDTIFITEINKINGEAQIEFKIADLSEIEFKINHKDLCSILVNLLDNAIEAVMKIENPDKRAFKISAYLYKDYVCFNFSNTFEILPKQINERFITSKPNKNLHGFGIKSVKDTVSRNQGLCHFEIQDSLFTVQVMLPIKSNHT